MKSPPTSKTPVPIWRVENGKIRPRSDQVTTEEPLEIRLVSPRRTLAITMRSPGHDFELIAGFLYSESVIACRDDIQRMSYCIDPGVDGEQRQNIVNVELRGGLTPNFQPLERHFYTTSACGVCGKASLEALQLRGYGVIPPGPQVLASTLYRLPEQLRQSQRIFSSTGGLHAAALFDTMGKLLSIREDVGRHNALDKLMGAALLSDQLPLTDRIILVSGRSSFEILQKSLAAKVPIVCAVSAPSSLAVSLAQRFGITLIGFLRDQRFNVYSGIERIIEEN